MTDMTEVRLTRAQLERILKEMSEGAVEDVIISRRNGSTSFVTYEHYEGTQRRWIVNRNGKAIMEGQGLGGFLTEQ